MKLGRRMAAIAAMVPRGSRVGDIGTDHAYLPSYLVTEGFCPWAVAGDIHEGPYLSALGTVAGGGLTGQIDVRLGDGLAVLTPGEVDTVIIAGMGGAAIIQILSGRPEITSALSRLVLQPMIAAAGLRRWLVGHGWQLVDETLVEEDGRIYEIIPAEPGQSADFDAVLYDIGPLLWIRRHPLLKVHLELLITRLKKIVGEMAGSSAAVNSSQYREYCGRIAQLEEKYRCL